MLPLSKRSTLACFFSNNFSVTLKVLSLSIVASSLTGFSALPKSVIGPLEDLALLSVLGLSFKSIPLASAKPLI